MKFNHRRILTFGMHAMAAIKPLKLVSLDLIVVLAIISPSAKNAIKRIRHIFINSKEKRFPFRINHLKTTKILLKEHICFATLVENAY